MLLPLLIGPRLFCVESGSQPCRAELVVELALLRIAEDVVGVGDILEFILGFLVARVDIRMILAREFAVCLANLLLGGASVDSKNLVVIPVGHGRSRIAPGRGVSRGRRTFAPQMGSRGKWV